MEPPFPHIESHKVFPFTFLLRTSFQVSFAPVDLKKNSSAFVDFFKLEFNVTLTDSQLNLLDAKGLSLKSEDEGLTWVISNGSIAVDIEHNRYVSFDESLSPIVQKIEEFLNRIGTVCRLINLQKIDLFPFDNKIKEKVDSCWNAVFSSSFLKARLSEPLTCDDTSCFYINNFDGTDGINMTIISGYIIENDDESKQPSRYVMDCRATYNSETKSIAATTRKMNNLLYDAFIWSMSPMVISLMEKGE